tara:strand:+ start:270 stop:1214 length:945 start_codon:yes stop_codon:yes gene_type:complete
MKKIIFSLLVACLPFLALCQNMKPSMMVVPADIYMTQNGWLDENGNNDYITAFKNDNNLRLAVIQMSEFMGKRGFNPMLLEEKLKEVQEEQMFNDNYSGREGDEIQLNLLDEIFNMAKPDLKLEMDFSLIPTAPGSAKMLYTLQAIDSYSLKGISSVSGTGAPGFASDIATLLQESIKDNMDDFCKQMTDHFYRTVEIGREFAIDIKINVDDLYFDDEYEYEAYDMDDELTYIIEEYFKQNTVNGVCKLVSASDKQLKFREVMVAVKDEKGRSKDARQFANGLRKILKKEPFNIGGTAKPFGGPGKAVLILGNK